MCRIFGFRSVIQSQVHSSLLHAENALGVQSQRHPDGWGVAYYTANAPHLIRSRETAIDDRLFQKVSGLVASQTVLAHLRKATLGDKSILNTHPFQYGPWVFAHNGHIKNFDSVREEIKLKTLPHLKKFILGDTDSELIFYFLLSEMDKQLSLDQRNVDTDILVQTIKQALNKLIKIIGPCNFDAKEIDHNHNYLTFILTNGECMVAHQGGQPLNYSTYKTRCGDREHCPAYSAACENVSVDSKVNHLILSSEPLSGENIWLKLENHDIIGVCKDMKMFRTNLLA